MLVCFFFPSSDSIEEYIQTTGSHVESANQELAKASHHQVKFIQYNSDYKWIN